jgi:hypothetical protein
MTVGAGIYGGIGPHMEHCPNCGGVRMVIASILEQRGIENVLAHLGVQARAPPQAPFRGQALHAARGRPTGTVQATQHPGAVESAATAGLRDMCCRIASPELKPSAQGIGAMNPSRGRRGGGETLRSAMLMAILYWCLPACFAPWRCDIRAPW